MCDNLAVMCDTLRNDDDSGDECVHCGAVYPDPARRTVYIATRVVSSPTPGQVRAPRATRGVTTHSFNFGPRGGGGLALLRGTR